MEIHGVELNGVTNIQLAMRVRTQEISPELKQFIEQELAVLERYLLACEDVRKELSEKPGKQLTFPFWHEVRNDPKKFPSKAERMSSFMENKK